MTTGDAVDQAILEVAMLNLPSPPAIMRPFFEPEVESRKILDNVRGQVRDAEQAIDRFEADGLSVRDQLKEILGIHRDVISDRHLDNIFRMAVLLEEKAERLAKDAVSAFNAIEKANRKISAILGEKAAQELADLYQRLRQTYAREIDANTDMALFLRGLKAEYGKDSRGGPRFDNSKDLVAYLNKLAG